MRIVGRSPLICTHNVTSPTASSSVLSDASDLSAGGLVTGWPLLVAGTPACGSNVTVVPVRTNRPITGGTGFGSTMLFDVALPAVFGPAFSEKSPANGT